MNKKQLRVLFIVLLIGLSFIAIGIYGKCIAIKKSVHEEKMRIVCEALDNMKATIDHIKSLYEDADFSSYPENQIDAVEWINLHIDSYEEHYIMYKDMVGDIPRESTLPRVSITPMPIVPTLTPTVTPTSTPTPTPTLTPIPTLTSTPTPSPTPTVIPVGVVQIYGNEISDDEETVVEAIIDNEVIGSAEFKVRGNTSTKLSKKCYNIKFDEKISLYDMGKGKKWCLLATAYEKSLLRTPIAFEYAKAIGLPYVPDFRFVELWLNGSYRGLYLLTEPVQDGKGRVDLDLKNGDFLIESNTLRTEDNVNYITTAEGFRFEINEPEILTNSDIQFIKDRLDEIEAAIVTRDYQIYSEYIDVESFVNFYIFTELTKDIDLGRASTRFFQKDGKLYAGPPWDMDLTMGNVSSSHYEDVYKRYSNVNSSGNSYEGLWTRNILWYKWLCEDSYFMELVVKRWNELLPTTMSLVYDGDDSLSLINQYLTNYSEYLEKNYASKDKGGAGWKVNKKTLSIEYDGPASTYVGNVGLLEDWLINRIDWLNNEFN